MVPVSNMNSIQNHDMAALRSYITAEDQNPYSSLHKSTLMVDLTHSNLVQKHIEIRFDKSTKLQEVRDVIHRKTGTPPCSQLLQIKYAGSGIIVCEIRPDDLLANERMLGYFGLENGVTIHCVDLDPNSGSRNGQYEDVSLVKKYVMSDEDYDRRKGTLRDWGRQQKMEDPNFTMAGHARRHKEMVEANRRKKQGLDPNVTLIQEEEEIPGEESIQGIEVGMRCEVQPGGRRGSVQYVGEISHLGTGGFWIGVKFDEPVGKTDGSIKGKSYFEASPGFGGFVRGKNIQVGDFPERDIFDELDDSDDEL